MHNLNLQQYPNILSQLDTQQQQIIVVSLHSMPKKSASKNYYSKYGTRDGQNSYYFLSNWVHGG